MRTFTHTFTSAGEMLPLPGGNFFQILNLDAGDVDVEYWRDGRPVAIETGNGVDAGYVSDQRVLAEREGRADAFEKVLVTGNNAGQTITVGISRGRGGFNKFTGDVNVTNANLDVTSTEVPLVLPSSNLSTQIIFDTATTLSTIVTPAANTNGVRVYAISIGQSAALGRLMAKTSAPASATDTGALSIAVALGSAQTEVNNRLPFDIPAGYGLYHQQSAANTRMLGLLYEVL